MKVKVADLLETPRIHDAEMKFATNGIVNDTDAGHSENAIDECNVMGVAIVGVDINLQATL